MRGKQQGVGRQRSVNTGKVNGRKRKKEKKEPKKGDGRLRKEHFRTNEIKEESKKAKSHVKVNSNINGKNEKQTIKDMQRAQLEQVLDDANGERALELDLLEIPPHTSGPGRKGRKYEVGLGEVVQVEEEVQEEELPFYSLPRFSSLPSYARPLPQSLGALLGLGP